MDAVAALQRPRLGAISLVLESVRQLLPQFGLLFPIAVLPSLAVTELSGRAERAAASPGGDIAFVWFAAAVIVLVSILVMAVLTLAALDGVQDQRRPIGAYFGQALGHAGALVVLGLIVTIFVMAGLMLLVLPGLYLAARFLPWMAATLYEDAGWAGLARGQELTQGFRWPLVGSILVFAVASVIVPLPAVLLAEQTDGVATLLLETAGTTVSNMLCALYAALAYLRLRQLEA